MRKTTALPVHDASGITTAATIWGQGVQLVKEDDTRSGVPGPLEDPAHVFLALTHVHVYELRTCIKQSSRCPESFENLVSGSRVSRIADPPYRKTQHPEQLPCT